MSKYQLVINSDDPNEVSALLAALGSSTAVATVQNMSGTPAAGVAMPGSGAPGSMSSDDDEDGNTGNDAPADPNSLDKNGLPWDDRIHSTPAALTEKGVWRAKRGVGKDKAFVAQVEAELRNRGQQPQQMQPAQASAVQPMPVQQPQYQPQPVAQPVSAPFDPAQQFQPVHQPPMPQPQQQFTQPPIQQQPVAVQQPQYQPQPIPSMDFNAFMQKIQYLLQQRDVAGNAFIDAAYLQTVTAQIGREFQVQINAITDIMNNQQMIDRAVQIMASAGKWM